MTKSNNISFEKFERIVFFTGAGISAESGVPTFRGKGGIWEKYDYEQYACQAAFDRDPEKVWEFHNARREVVARCEPNRGHEIIGQLQKERPGDVAIVTQNIDGLHLRGGAMTVHELHGSLWRVRCERCGVVEQRLEAPLTELQHDCGAWWRPDIVWFGDALDGEVIEASIEAISRCQLLVSIGTSGVVFPAAQLPLAAKKAGSTLVEINPEPTAMSDAYDHCLRGSASEMLAELAGR